MRSDLTFLVAFAGIIIVLAAIGFFLIDKQMSRQQAYEDCVSAIPGYLDAEEIRYQEQECKQGWRP